ncbi:hypothetical protein Pelo_17615 [Pelomyxa schiedti]|nr:hypothetical protein Pelo_17615 [Pelomyxa schiedti]
MYNISGSRNTMTALPPHLFYFAKSDILNAMKNGESEILCGYEKRPVHIHAIGNILILSLDDSGPGPWAKIKEPDSINTLCRLNFIAPEVISHLPFDTKADVWSFGMTAAILMDPLKRHP